MKLHLRNIVLTAGLSALLGSLTLSAQVRKQLRTFRSHTTSGNRLCPPANTSIQETTSRGILQLRDNASGHSIFVPVHTGRIPEKTSRS